MRTRTSRTRVSTPSRRWPATLEGPDWAALRCGSEIARNRRHVDSSLPGIARAGVACSSDRLGRNRHVATRSRDASSSILESHIHCGCREECVVNEGCIRDVGSPASSRRVLHCMYLQRKQAELRCAGLLSADSVSGSVGKQQRDAAQQVTRRPTRHLFSTWP